MLTDEQIDRYSRHVILPQFGARRQEAWLRSAVTLGGPLATALETCGLALGAAGVGFLGVDGSAAARERLARVVAERNPDVRVDSPTTGEAGVRVLLGGGPFGPLSRTTLWGSTGRDRMVRILLPPRRACDVCLRSSIDRTALSGEPGTASETLLGLFLAVDVSRVLLELPGTNRAEVFTLDLETFRSETRAVPVAPDCTSCTPD